MPLIIPGRVYFPASAFVCIIMQFPAMSSRLDQIPSRFRQRQTLTI